MVAPIAILGAGPAGLTLARLLEINNVDYIVFERDISPSHRLGHGGSLDLRPDSGLQALKEAGLYEEFKRLARYDGQEMKVIDKNGEIVWYSPYEGEEYNPEIDRTQLRQILLDSVPGSKIRWDSMVSNVHRESDGTMRVDFKNGTSEAGFKLVVGADGAWSKVTTATPTYAGITVVQGVLKPSSPAYPQLSEKIGRGTHLGLGYNMSVISQRLSDGSYNIYIMSYQPEHWGKTSGDLTDPQTYRGKILSQIDDWTEDLKDLVRNSEGEYFAWPLYNMPVDALSWKPSPGVTLIGDAAHVTTPWEGEGVNVSMSDSMDLARAIVKNGLDDLSTAVAEYEAIMLPRGADLIQRSSNSQASTVGPDAASEFKKRIPHLGGPSES